MDALINNSNGGGLLSSVASSVTNRAKQVAAVIPGSTTIACVGSKNTTECQQKVKFKNDLRSLMLKGPGDASAMQRLKQTMDQFQRYGLKQAEATEIYHELVKETNFDEAMYHTVVSSVATTTPAAAAGAAPAMVGGAPAAMAGGAAATPALPAATGIAVTQPAQPLPPAIGMPSAQAIPGSPLSVPVPQPVATSSGQPVPMVGGSAASLPPTAASGSAATVTPAIGGATSLH